MDKVLYVFSPPNIFLKALSYTGGQNRQLRQNPIRSIPGCQAVPTRESLGLFLLLSLETFQEGLELASGQAFQPRGHHNSPHTASHLPTHVTPMSVQTLLLRNPHPSRLASGAGLYSLSQGLEQKR